MLDCNMGIKYNDSVIVYNRYTVGTLETEYYIGRRYDNVRVELTQGMNIASSGLESANSVTVKIPRDEVANYMPPAKWMDIEDKTDIDTFMTDSLVIIAKKEELGIDYNIELPTGLVRSDDYDRGFMDYLKRTYGYTYNVKTIDIYQMIPRYELGGV